MFLQGVRAMDYLDYNVWIKHIFSPILQCFETRISENVF